MQEQFLCIQAASESSVTGSEFGCFYDPRGIVGCSRLPHLAELPGCPEHKLQAVS